MPGLTKAFPVIHGVDEDEAVWVVVLHQLAGVVISIYLHQAELCHDVVHIYREQTEIRNDAFFPRKMIILTSEARVYCLPFFVFIVFVLLLLVVKIIFEHISVLRAHELVDY